MKQMNYFSDLDVIDGMEGHDFEFFCANVLKNIGYTDVKVTKGSGDQGVDVLATKDGIKYAIQCKNYASKLSNTPVQEVSAGKTYYGCHVGVVMTNSTFTQGAVELAEANSVLLWDRSKLQELIEMAGGLERFGYASINHNQELNSENYNINNSGNYTYDNHFANVKCHRKGMSAFSHICLGWAVLCFIMFAGGLFTKEKILMEMGISEGLFSLIFGLMFRSFITSPNWNPYIVVFGKNIKKPLFVVICIVAAFVCFLGTSGIFGGLQ